MINNKILIVDDEPDICDLVSDILSDNGYSVKRAFSKDEAIKVMENSGISLVITDIWMNDNEKEGFELLEWCKAYNALTPVLIMSGHGTIEYAMNAAKNGAYDFLEKPFNSDRLLFLVKKALQEYDGTLILVSHDRDFLSNLTDKVYEFYDKNIKEYIGDIDVFLKEKKLNNLKQLEKQYEANTNTKNKNSEKNTKKQINLLSKKISSLERQIEKFENDQKNDDLILSDPIKFKKLSKNNDFFQKYENRKNKINNLLDEWNCQIDLLEKLKKQTK